jgi:hypothetical protein
MQPATADTVPGAADYRGQPASRAATGGWKSSVFVMGTFRFFRPGLLCMIDMGHACDMHRVDHEKFVCDRAAMEIAERFAYSWGVAANLITYLTGPLGQPMARAAASIDAWKGVSQMLPLPIACVADAWLGWFWAIIIFSLIFIVVNLASRTSWTVRACAFNLGCDLLSRDGRAVAVVGVPGGQRRPRGHLLRGTVPDALGRGRAQAVLAGVRGRPVRREGPQGERGAELLLQLVLRHVRWHRRHDHGLQLRPGQRRPGPRPRHPLHRHRRVAGRVPDREPVVQVLHRQGGQPILTRRGGVRGVDLELGNKSSYQVCNIE